MPNTKHDYVDIEKIEFDLENPRIIKELSAIEESERADNAAALLHISFSDEPGPAREELERSIVASGGISRAIEIVPIVGTDRYKVIDGNTRLAVYKKLKTADPDNENWHAIQSLIYDIDDDEDEQLMNIRLLAHFMPVKQWSQYAKGQFIDGLCQTKSFEEIAEKLGGKTSEIRKIREAYVFFRDYYEPHLNNIENHPGADESKFSHFREALGRGVEVALESHFGDLDTAKKNFAKWVDDDKFRMAIHVRKIPAVFNHEDAKNAFLNNEVDNIEDAVKLIPIEGDHGAVNIDDASIEELATQLSRNINVITREDMRSMQDGRMQSTVDSLLLLGLDLEKVIDEIESKETK